MIVDDQPLLEVPGNLGSKTIAVEGFDGVIGEIVTPDCDVVDPTVCGEPTPISIISFAKKEWVDRADKIARSRTLCDDGVVDEELEVTTAVSNGYVVPLPLEFDLFCSRLQGLWF